jgi:hypothetical protein
MSVESATWRVFQQFSNHLKDSDDGPVVWLALGLLQLEHGRLQPMVRNQVLGAIRTGVLLNRWGEATADKLAERQEVLDNLRARFTAAATI